MKQFCTLFEIDQWSGFLTDPSNNTLCVKYLSQNYEMGCLLCVSVFYSRLNVLTNTELYNDEYNVNM